MRIGPRKVLAGVALLGLVVVTVAAHLLAGAAGLLTVVLLVQVAVLLAVLELRVRLPRELRRVARPGRTERRVTDELRRQLREHLRAVEDLEQRHSEGQAQALRDAVVRLEAAIADATATPSSPPDPGPGPTL